MTVLLNVANKLTKMIAMKINHPKILKKLYYHYLNVNNSRIIIKLIKNYIISCCSLFKNIHSIIRSRKRFVFYKIKKNIFVSFIFEVNKSITTSSLIVMTFN